VLCGFKSELTKEINKITYKTDKNTNIFVILLVLFVILFILFVNSLFKQQITQLPAMKAVIYMKIFNCEGKRWMQPPAEAPVSILTM
jgi:hypothetical protein